MQAFVGNLIQRKARRALSPEFKHALAREVLKTERLRIIALIITGLRQAFLRAWIAVVGAEMLAASDWGLGWVIFDAKEFLNADVMLAALAVIGAIGFLFERLVFGSIERATVMRWGMVRTAKG